MFVSFFPRPLLFLLSAILWSVFAAGETLAVVEAMLLDCADVLVGKVDTGNALVVRRKREGDVRRLAGTIRCMRPAVMLAHRARSISA